MKKLIKGFREWRDRRFRERIDRVYFRCDVDGNRYIFGNLYVKADSAKAFTGRLVVAKNVNIRGGLRVSEDIVAGKDVVAYANASLGAGLKELKDKKR